MLSQHLPAFNSLPGQQAFWLLIQKPEMSGYMTSRPRGQNVWEKSPSLESQFSRKEWSRKCPFARPIPKISQETLAEIVDTTRSRVSFFMNRFRKLGFIQYNGQYSSDLEVHSSLLNVILDD